MTTDLSLNTSCLSDRVKSAPIETSIESLKGQQRRSVRNSLLAGGKRRSLAAQQRQSLKFCAKNFVTKFSEDLEKHYEMGDLLGKTSANVVKCDDILHLMAC